MKIEVTNVEVNERTVHSERRNRSFKFRTQQGMVAINGETRRIELPLGDDQAAWPMGTYEIDLEKSLYVDRYGRLELGKLQLKAVPGVPRKVA